MPDTGHRVVINIDKLKSRMPEIKKYKKITIVISADNGKTYTVKPDSFFSWL
jgi:hypothetical protein